MDISKKDWLGYVRRLEKIDKKAGELMRAYIDLNGTADTAALIDYAYGIATAYGEASAALSCEMYDAIAEASGRALPAAEPAATATYGETAKTVNGVLKQSQDPEMLSSSVSRLVKRAGADTTLKNAERDGSEFAWIPMGDTCAFCITLASRGWQRQSRKAMKGGHAEHIHSNCDCTYAVRFGGKGGVSGYDPDRYLEMYENAEGRTPEEKINSMRRAQYAEDKERINEQKRAAYAERKEKKQSSTIIDITQEYFSSAHPGIGNIVFDKGYDKQRHVNEIITAQWIHDTFGGDITLQAESLLSGEKTADYRWNGKLWDLKNTSSEKAADSALRKGLKQINTNPGGIILDYGNKMPDIEKLDKIIESRMKRSSPLVADVIIKSENNVIKIIRHKK